MLLFRSALFAGLLLLVVVVRTAVFLYAIGEELPPCALGVQQLDLIVNEARMSAGAPAILDVSVLEHRARSNQADCPLLEGVRLRLTWYQPQMRTIAAGFVLRAIVKLKLPGGSRNPGTFDYERWLHGQGYVATGYVRAVDTGPPVSSEPQQVTQSAFAGLVHGGLLAAMTLGERAHVTESQWAVLRATGTIHLVIVSGLHVGILGALSFITLYTLLRLNPLVKPIVRPIGGLIGRRIGGLNGGLNSPQFHPRVWAALGSVCVIAIYTLQTGAAAPVVRASLMAGVAIVALTCMRPLAWWRIYLIGLSFSILLNPAVVLQHGFYLSFIAVGLLLWRFAPSMRTSSWVRNALICQVVLSLGLSPWVGLLAGEMPLVSALANIIVVPPMTLLIIPLAFAGVLVAQLPALDALAALLLFCADVCLGVILGVLERMVDQLPVFGPLAWPPTVIAWIGALIVISPNVRPLFCVGVLAWLPVTYSTRMFVPAGEVRIQILDVGQGSAAIIDTRAHRMIVDVGPRFKSGFDVGAAIVLPVLRYTGPQQLDRVLLTHRDNDHAGGMHSVVGAFQKAEVIAPGEGCRSGRTWRWDEVDFVLLTYPQGKSANDRSCTLVILTRSHNIYFAGDIGRATEAHLLPDLPDQLDLLIAPHHGSETSSHREFVARMTPRIVVYSVGRDNRYGHPRPAVVDRYARVGSTQFSTAQSGALSWNSTKGRCLTQMRRGVQCIDAQE